MGGLNLYLLRRLCPRTEIDDGEVIALVVADTDAQEARKCAALFSENEGESTWYSERRTSCEYLGLYAGDSPCLILRSVTHE